jgi:hypothetical protein
MPVAPLIDTFVVGAVLLALYEDFSPRERAALRLALHAVMFVNACVGLAEFAFDFRLTPFVAGGRAIVGDYRSTALLGHPLVNVGTTTLYAAMLVLGADRALRLPLRLALTTIQLVALVAFGGRTSLTLAIVVVCLAALKPISEAFGGRRFDLRSAIAAALVVPLAASAAAAAWFDGALRQVSLNGALMFGLMAPAAVGVALLAGPFVRLAVAQQFQAQTIVILPLAVLAGAARALRVHTGDQTALLVRRTRSMTVFNLIDAVAALAGGAVGEYFGGVVGAAVGCLAGTLVGSTAAMAFGVARLGLRLPLAALAGVLAASAIMGAALRLVPPPIGALGLAAQIVAGVFIYAAVILVLFPQARRIARTGFAFVAERRGSDQ